MSSSSPKCVRSSPSSALAASPSTSSSRGIVMMTRRPCCRAESALRARLKRERLKKRQFEFSIFCFFSHSSSFLNLNSLLSPFFPSLAPLQLGAPPFYLCFFFNSGQAQRPCARPQKQLARQKADVYLSSLSPPTIPGSFLIGSATRTRSLDTLVDRKQCAPFSSSSWPSSRSVSFQFLTSSHYIVSGFSLRRLE